MSKRSKARMKDLPPPLRPPVPRPDLAQSKCACGASAGVTGECVECAQKKLAFDRRGADEVAPIAAPPTVSEVARAPGEPLDSETRASMESSLGHDFSRVRVHTDDRAAESANEVNALAYTIGQDVVFARGQYSPRSVEGQKLLAHELAHTIQQSSAQSDPGGTTPVGARGSVFEREADMAAEGLFSGSHIAAMTPSMPSLQKKTPEELAGEALKAGPKGKKEKAEFEKAGKAEAKVEKAGTTITRVEIPAAGKDEPVKGVTSSEYASESKKCATPKSEAGLPKAFLCTTQEITPPNVAPDDAATFDTNVRVSFKKGKGGGSIWVVSASLPWVLNTAGFLDTSAIDTQMLKPYDTHEQGHRTIAHQVRDRLSKLIQVELEGALPTEKSPLKKSGKTWDQDGVDSIIKQISDIRDRYMKWFDELTAAADSAWDAQEKATLNKIAAAIKAKEFKPGQSVPEVKE
ncbi:MAG TPA: DUF4157 domain-containing protein [Blastocatellia bacterium]|nr:DUF4157 domain-containing protein [Blastocatellia bacterium]